MGIGRLASYSFAQEKLMPRYEYLCERCKITRTVWQRIEDLDVPGLVVLCECFKPMKRLISAPSINPDVPPYLEENMAHEPVYIKSRQHRKDELKRRNLHDGWGEGL